jgi:hypothetical protein
VFVLFVYNNDVELLHSAPLLSLSISISLSLSSFVFLPFYIILSLSRVAQLLCMDNAAAHGLSGHGFDANCHPDFHRSCGSKATPGTIML